MLRKEQRRHERRQSLRQRLLAGSTAVIIALGMAVGGAAPAFATGGDQKPSTVPTVVGVTVTNDNGLTCNKSGFDKPDSMDKSSGSYEDVWGSVVWAENGNFTWTLKAGYDVDFCVKGATYVSAIDSSVFSGTSYNFSAQTGHGISHTGFKVVAKPSEPPFSPDWEYAAPYCEGITIAFPANLPQGQQGVMEVNVEFSFGTLQYKLEGDAYKKAYPQGHAGKTVALTWDQFRNGTVPNKPFTIKWVQVHGTNYHWKGSVACGDLTTENLVTPDARRVDLACNTAGSYTLDAIEGVRWYIGTTEVKPGTYTVSTKSTVVVRAEAVSPTYGLDPDAPSTFTFVFTTPEGCTPPPCLPNDAISYTYVKSGVDANTGVVTVTQKEGFSDQLCKPLYVTAAAWAFDKIDNVWTQTLVTSKQINGGTAITEVGVYPYGVPVGCGQGDIYASRTAFPKPSPLLLGPNKPAWPAGVTPWTFSEVFLHDMGFTGPKPTYVVTPAGCNGIVPVPPTFTVIDQCGEYGSIAVNSDNPNIAYIVKDADGKVVPVAEAREGQFTVIAIASFPYLLKGYPAGGWTIDVKSKYNCPVTPTATPTAENCLDGDGTITFGDVDGIESYSVKGVDVIFAPGATLTGLAAGTYTITAVADAGSVLVAESSPFDVVVAASSENCGIATAAVRLPPASCELGQSWSDAVKSSENATFGSMTRSDDLYVIVATAAQGYLFEGGAKTKTFRVSLAAANEELCAPASAAIAKTAPTCFSGSSLDAPKFTVSDGVTWSIVDDGMTDGTYEVVFTAPSGSRFENGKSTLAITGDLAPALAGEECVLPITNVVFALTLPTCLDAQALDPGKYSFDPELAQQTSSTVNSETGEYVVVFSTIGARTTFDQSKDVALPGRVVSDGGKTLTFTGTLEGRDSTTCKVLPVVDPFDYVDTCVEASFTLYSVEGLTYLVTINEDKPYAAVFGDDEVSTKIVVENGDYVLVEPVANEGYVLSPDQPAPLDRQFTEYGADDCQLPDLANWPASASATNQVCTALGMSSGAITVEFSVGSEGNPNPVRYYLAYGTAQQQELTSKVTPVAPGAYEVTAVASVSADSLNDSGNTAVLPVRVGASATDTCDLPTLAFTGASSALVGMGFIAVILTLAGMGFVVGRRQNA